LQKEGRSELGRRGVEGGRAMPMGDMSQQGEGLCEKGWHANAPSVRTGKQGCTSKGRGVQTGEGGETGDGHMPVMAHVDALSMKTRWWGVHNQGSGGCTTGRWRTCNQKREGQGGGVMEGWATHGGTQKGGKEELWHQCQPP